LALPIVIERRIPGSSIVYNAPDPARQHKVDDFFYRRAEPSKEALCKYIAE
jgi:hypothetical protein